MTRQDVGYALANAGLGKLREQAAVDIGVGHGGAFHNVARIGVYLHRGCAARDGQYNLIGGRHARSDINVLRVRLKARRGYFQVVAVERDVGEAGGAGGVGLYRLLIAGHLVRYLNGSADDRCAGRVRDHCLKSPGGTGRLGRGCVQHRRAEK